MDRKGKKKETEGYGGNEMLGLRWEARKQKKEERKGFT